MVQKIEAVVEQIKELAVHDNRERLLVDHVERVRVKKYEAYELSIKAHIIRAAKRGTL